MATDIHNLPTLGTAEHPPTRTRAKLRAAVCTFFAALTSAFCRLFTYRKAKRRPVPVIHEDVTLTPEGVEVWNNAMDPNTPIGKPSHHRRRRLPSGDAS